MKIFILPRFIQDNKGTFGVLMTKGFACFTIERPWKDNRQYISCIPAGEYIMVRDNKGKHKYFKLLNVPDRKNIEIHVANFPEDVEGCIGFGESYNDQGVLESKHAINRFMRFMEGEDKAILKIKCYENKENLNV